MGNPLRVLVLEDRASDAELLVRELRRAGYDPQWERVDTEQDYLEKLKHEYDIILSDYSMPQFDGMRALRLLRERGSQIPFILVSGTMGEETAVAAMKEGATDYLLKDRLARLGPAVAQAVEQSRLRQERVLAEEALRESEERFRQIAENIEEVFWITDPTKNQILYISPGYELIWGRRCADVYDSPKSWMEAIHPDDRARVMEAALTKQVAGTYDEEYRIVRPDGSIRMIHDCAFPVRNEQGEIYRVVGVARDVTESKLAEEAIEASEQRFAAFMDNLPARAWIKDAQGRYVYINKLVRDHTMRGLDWAGKRDDELWPQELAEVYARNDQRVIESGKPVQTIEKVLHDGEVRISLNSKFPILTSAGEQLVCGVGIDITEQRHAEEELAALRRQHELILQSVGEGIHGIDLEGNITFENPAAARLLGRQIKDLIGRPAHEMIHHSRADGTAYPPEECPIYRTLHDGVARRHSDEVFWRKDGTSLPVEYLSAPIRDEAGKIAGAVVTFRDITERKKAEEAIRTSETRLRALVESMDDIAIEFDGEGTYVAIWTMRDDLLSRPREELLGRTISEIHGPERAALFLNGIRRAMKSRVIETLEYEMKNVAGVERRFQSRTSPIINPDGSCERVCILSRDVTEQKRLENQFLRAQRLESIGTLASGVAHDLNNILAPILIGASVLRRTKMPPSDEAILSTIETCAERGADIVRQVLTFARGAEGERLPLEAAPLIKDVAKIAQETFPKQITVRTHIAEPLWTVLGDPTQLHQVLLNLSVNARDAMPAGGTLTLSAENFPVDDHYASMTPGAKAGPHVRFGVVDTGTGIPPQNLDKIFDPFFTTKELGHGTGLGLSSVIGIVKSHGGFLGVYSEIGRGTTFRVYLPAEVDEQATLKEAPGASLPPAQGELLLLVDDETPILQIAQALLQGHGYEVLTAEDAAAALAIFAMRKDDIRLVLTDLSMPVMDGVALIRTLRKMKPDVPIIASTGRGGHDLHSPELQELNVRTCLTKPYNKDKLLKTLHDALHAQPDES